ncbi:hypothetical protein O181_102727 [Austropuccinia psidii MF-1]|uniref:Uncharacterized protein n=1 Tax=Austropuccinia psidii MF-1 TaxID=1389203 RepID=A0A9Q3JJQ4_9BASI|nr:hypothetical protein [Austropuccinia psidii MF-1]
MHPVLKDSGVVHIWYYIPLCTIFAQESNGDVFRTQFDDSKSRSQNPSPILKEDSSAHQTGNPWWLSEDHFRTPTTWLCRSWVGNSFMIIPRGHSQRLFIIKSAVKAESTSILLGQLNWSIQAAINHTCMSLAQLGQFIFHCGNSITQLGSQDDQSCIDPIQTIQPDDSPSRISHSAFHIYWPPFITWGLFPQLINILDLFLSLFSFTLLK